jgi:hypothetical protein
MLRVGQKGSEAGPRLGSTASRGAVNEPLRDPCHDRTIAGHARNEEASMIAVQSSLSQYLLVNHNLPQAITTYEKSTPSYQRAVTAFQAALPSIKTVDDLLNNRQALTVALGAFQLESQVDAKGLLKKLLTQDPSNSTSLVNQLNDPRYKQFAQAFGSLSTDGGAGINASGFADKIIASFGTNQFEESEGNQNPAVREALYFQRIAGQVTSVYQVLADPTIGDVVRTAQGLPAEAGALDVDQQVAQLKRSGFDVTKLTDPAFIAKYVQRYLVMNDLNNPSTDPTGGLAGLLAGSNGSGADNSSAVLGILGSASGGGISSGASGGILSLFA